MPPRQEKWRSADATRDRARYEALQRAVQAVGPIRRGSLVRRFIPCGKPGCACQAQPPVLHGPYYQWTRKVRGKTVTVRLTPAAAQLVGEWIANGRQLNRLVAQMETVSLRLTDRLLRHLPPG
jgi:uncharacterized protein DUF6788